LHNLLEIADDLYLDLEGTYLTLDAGFDSKFNESEINNVSMVPVIKPNLGNLQNEEKRHQRLDKFEAVENIYKERCNIERCFAWEDTYRKLVIRYEKLRCTFMGFRYLAYSMINYRSFFKQKRC